MKAISGFLILSLVGLLAAAPAQDSDDDETLVITKEFYPSVFLKYTGKHDIVNLLVPLNSLNFDENDLEANSNETDDSATIFFVEADTTPEGKRIDKGLYVLDEGVVTKLLENGRDAAASSDDSKLVYLGASDGVYVYKDGSAKKYGSLTDSVIGIAKETSGDNLYILTENNEVYNVTDAGNKKEKINAIANAKQIVLDSANNLYSSDDKQVEVLTSEGVKKIAGLPENPSSLTLVKPFFALDEGVPVIINTSTYMVYPNGTSERVGIEFEPKAKPTAYGGEAGIIQYYAYDKKIYEYNVLALLLSSDLEEVKNFLNENAEEVRAIAAKPKKSSN